jgi:hypothetical protein
VIGSAPVAHSSRSRIGTLCTCASARPDVCRVPAPTLASCAQRGSRFAGEQRVDRRRATRVMERGRDDAVRALRQLGGSPRRPLAGLRALKPSLARSSGARWSSVGSSGSAGRFYPMVSIASSIRSRWVRWLSTETRSAWRPSSARLSGEASLADWRLPPEPAKGRPHRAGLGVRGGSAVATSALLLEDRASLAVLLETQFAFGEAPLEYVDPGFPTAARPG